jgi:hypothetical protein
VRLCADVAVYQRLSPLRCSHRFTPFPDVLCHGCVIIPTVAGALNDAFAKLGRADEHAITLVDEIAAWQAAAPFHAQREPNNEASDHDVIVTIDAPPDVRRWGLLFGDAIDNLRSALDHVVYGLAQVATGEDEPPGARSLAFPLINDEQRWSDADSRLRSLSPAMVPAIKEVQPFHRAEPH